MDRKSIIKLLGGEKEMWRNLSLMFPKQKKYWVGKQNEESIKCVKMHTNLRHTDTNSKKNHERFRKNDSLTYSDKLIFIDFNSRYGNKTQYTEISKTAHRHSSKMRSSPDRILKDILAAFLFRIRWKSGETKSSQYF